MTNSTKNAGIRVKSAVRAAGFGPNHNASVSTKNAGIRVKSAVRAAGFGSNHNASLIAAR